MKWIDMHCDTLSEAIKRGEGIEKNHLCADIERLMQGGACAQLFACFVNAGEYGLGTADVPQELVWEKSWSAILKMTETARRAENEKFKIIRTPGELSGSGEKLSGILTVEEGGVLNGRLERLDELYKRGVRLMTLTWNYENCIGSPNSRNPAVMQQGLTEFGSCAVERMNELGMIVDVSHLSDGGFWDCMRQSRMPAAASHSNARAICTHPRNLSDSMLRSLGEKGGVAGVNFYSPFLREKGKADISDIVRHIRHMVNIAGEDAVALGSDFDGFETEDCPDGMNSVLDVGNIWTSLEKAGFTQRQIEKIAWGNVKRLIHDTWRE